LQEAAAGKRLLFFVDAAHFVHGAFLGYLWCFVRLFVSSSAGRKRFNVLGALNAVTLEVLTVVNESYINSATVCQLLTQIAQGYREQPITLVLDNARYQRCLLVQRHAAAWGIELLFLPAYSPQLNLIERFWRFVRKRTLYSQHYATFTDFKSAIDTCIQTAHLVHHDQLSTWLAWNFQSFQKVHPLPV